jgi:hypothetical protein
VSWLRLIDGASPQWLLSKYAGDLARVARQGHREGVLALRETERLALPTSTFEVAAKRAVECRGVETGYAPHQAGPRQRTQTAQLYSPEVLGPLAPLSL